MRAPTHNQPRNYQSNVLARAAVAVTPTVTVLGGPISCVLGSAMRVEVINDDISQTLDVSFDKSEAATGPWGASDYGGLLGIQPGETRCVVVDVRWLKYVRLLGVASGAGLSARVSITNFAGDLSW